MESDGWAPTATPTDAPTVKCRPLKRIGARIASTMRSAELAATFRVVGAGIHDGELIAAEAAYNVVGADGGREAPPDFDQHRSPTGWPCASLIGLKSSRSM